MLAIWIKRVWLFYVISDFALFHVAVIPFKRQPHKMVKHIQTIRRQIADELFVYVRPFCEVGAIVWWSE